MQIEEIVVDAIEGLVDGVDRPAHRVGDVLGGRTRLSSQVDELPVLFAELVVALGQQAVPPGPQLGRRQAVVVHRIDKRLAQPQHVLARRLAEL